MARERLQRALARAGHGSRRKAEALIAGGRVKVNDHVATLGDKVDPQTDHVELDGVTLNLDPAARYYALHKPTGVVTSLRDPQGRLDIRAYLPTDAPGVVPVGRLDRDSEGLLLLTNDGELANRLMHPRYGVEKEYLARVEGVPNATALAALRRGVALDDGPAKVRHVRVLEARGGRADLQVVMTEGRKREVRRLLLAVGHPVERLVRVRVGPVKLGRLGPGELRELTPEEVRALSAASGSPAS